MTKLLQPETSLVILIGASDWRRVGLGRAPSFRKSASAILTWLIDSRGLGMSPEHIIDLFDSDLSANDQLAALVERSEEIVEQGKTAGAPIGDVLIFYIGHGSLDSSGFLSLLIRQSRQGIEDQTSIRTADLARTLKVALTQQRYFLVLDCCFAEAAAKSFIGMGDHGQAVAASMLKDLTAHPPRRGGLLLCACPAGEPAFGGSGTDMTLFSSALVQTLRHGDTQGSAEFSFRDLRTAIEDRVLEQMGPRAPRPVLHVVNQKAGDLAALPAFVNPAFERAGQRRVEEGTSPHQRAPREAEQRKTGEDDAVRKQARRKVDEQQVAQQRAGRVREEAASKAAQEAAEREERAALRREEEERLALHNAVQAEAREAAIRASLARRRDDRKRVAILTGPASSWSIRMTAGMTGKSQPIRTPEAARMRKESEHPIKTLAMVLLLGSACIGTIVAGVFLTEQLIAQGLTLAGIVGLLAGLATAQRLITLRVLEIDSSAVRSWFALPMTILSMSGVCWAAQGFTATHLTQTASRSIDLAAVGLIYIFVGPMIIFKVEQDSLRRTFMMQLSRALSPLITILAGAMLSFDVGFQLPLGLICAQAMLLAMAQVTARSRVWSSIIQVCRNWRRAL